MGFFDDLRPTPPDSDDGDLVEYLGPLVLGAPTDVRLVLVHTPDAAVVLSRFVAAPSSLDFDVEVFVRAYRDGLHREVDFGVPFGESHSVPDSPRRFRLGVQFSDGTKVTNLDEAALRDDDVGGPSLVPGSGGIGGNRLFGMRFESEYVLKPLPPAGLLLFVCEWLPLGIPESRATVDAEVFRRAAKSALTLWETPPDREGQ